jgi:hypothetical protein
MDRIVARVMVCVAAAFVWACSDASQPGTTDGEDPQDVMGDGGDTDAAVPDPDGRTDTSVPDVADTSDGSSDGTDAPDSTGGEGELGDECAGDEDCDSGLCIEVESGSDVSVCSELCSTDDDCPRDFDCTLITNSGGDATRLCLPTDLCIDADDDGRGVGPGCEADDCDDNDPTSYVGADELCDGVDNDCDDDTDENALGVGDQCDTGFDGACARGRNTCAGGLLTCVQELQPAVEVCDTVDNDCDGLVDEDESGATLTRACYDGLDSELGVGQCVAGVQTCERGGYSSCRNQRTPIAETCDGLDNDCDGQLDEGLVLQLFYPDADGDGFGDAGAAAVEACARPEGYVQNRTDCNDASNTVFPGAFETPGDEIDSNCDGFELCYLDNDNDGVRPDELSTLLSTDADCGDTREAVVTDPVGDCRDDVRATFPGATELPGDGVDANCDGLELCFPDVDNDGFRDAISEVIASEDVTCAADGLAPARAPGDDCNDNNERVYPGALEVCDDLDNDCDSASDEGAGCYADGETCSGDADCESGFCDEGVCASGRGCLRPGACPSRWTVTSGGGRLSNAEYTLEVTATPPGAATLENGEYRLVVGSGAWIGGTR